MFLNNISKSSIFKSYLIHEKKEVEPFNVTTTALLKNSTNVQLLKQNFQLHLPLSDRKKTFLYSIYSNISNKMQNVEMFYYSN